MSETKERPILFSGPMVKAIIDGRKTQTRRIVKLPRGFDVNCYPRDKCGLDRVGVNADGMLELRVQTAVDDDEIHLFACPYGKPGDRLWVRETWKPDVIDPEGRSVSCIAYRADGLQVAIENSTDAAEKWIDARLAEEQWPDMRPPKWRPSIHMPRWASRITLEVTAVSVERLQDISEADAKAEGPEARMGDGTGPGSGFKWNGPGYWGGSRGAYGKTYHVPFAWKPQCSCNVGESNAATCAFREIWESINGAGSWAANPWVWVVEFKKGGTP